MPTIQDHISLDALTAGTLSTLKAIGVPDNARVHPHLIVGRYSSHDRHFVARRTPGSISA